MHAVRKWRLDLIMDPYEPHPIDQTPSFVEAMEPEAGARGAWALPATPQLPR